MARKPNPCRACLGFFTEHNYSMLHAATVIAGNQRRTMPDVEPRDILKPWFSDYHAAGHSEARMEPSAGSSDA